MATIDTVKKFSEQAIKVDRVFQKSGITGNAGRIVFILTLANTVCGVSQKEVIDGMGLPKDVVSKLVGSLLEPECGRPGYGLLTHEREETNARKKRLFTSDSGRDLLARVKASLQPSRPASPADKPQGEELTFFKM